MTLFPFPLAMFGYADFKPYPAWSLDTDAGLRRELKSALRDTGIEIALAEGFRVRSEGDVSEHLRELDIMAELGARCINAGTMEPDLGRTQDQLAALAELTEARGMVFAIEFSPTNAIRSLPIALEVADHIGRARCKIILDAMHFFRTGSTVDDLRKLDPARIGYAQLCDAPMTSSEPYLPEAMFARQAPGEGELPLRDWIAALPPDLPIGIEAPSLADLLAGMNPRDHAARMVAAARAVGA
jgi:sugar phosphate isomerase/epimerase